MVTEDSSSGDEPIQMIISESSNVKSSIEVSLINVEKLSTKEIIELYYQVINFTSLLKYLKQNFEGSQDNKTISNTIQESEKYIDEKFNENLHPILKSQLAKFLEKSRENLKSMKLNQKKTKEEIENQAKAYENLRQIMSTREFIEQYDKTIEI